MNDVERKRPAPTLLLLWALALLLAGCGGDTSVYFCSGSEEFCSGFRDRSKDDDEEDTSAAAAGQALTLARKTPRLIESGLAADQLETVALEAPSALGGWLLLSSLGAVVDDGDNAALSGFFDRVRLWLAADERSDLENPVLTAGMALLARLAAERDPAVAEALQRRLAERTAAREPSSVAAGAWPLPALRAELGAAEACCSERSLAAASVILCDVIAAPAWQETAVACAAAEGWLTQLSAR